ncbi:hypothetical protein TSMEX_001874 [Taenia solium]|eukprot:TsM_000277600 transcript=TsM_000277600 gene=TsM_000277600
MSSEDADTAHAKMCRKIYGNSVETVVNIVNEPSVALFRIQEHIRKTAPEIVEERKKAFVCAEKLQGVNYDLDNTLAVISTFPKVESNLVGLLKTLDACNIHRQNLVANRNKLNFRCMQHVIKCAFFFFVHPLTFVQMFRNQDDFELGVDVVALLANDV